MTITAYIILGLPHDDIEHMIESICALAHEEVLIGPSVFYPTPGTEIYKALRAEGKVREDDYALYRSTLVPIETEQFSRCDIVTLFRLVRMLNFMKKLVDEAPVSEYTTLAGLIHYYKSEYKCHFDLQHILRHGLERARALNEIERGIILLELFLHQKSFYGMRKRKREGRAVQYGLYPEESSSRVIDRFITKSNGMVLRGFHFAHMVTFDWTAHCLV